MPGFYHNLHSINHFHITEAPWFEDLGLAPRVSYITPRYEFGQAHLDGTALVLGRDLEETTANIARFSRKDAAVFREWNRKAEEITGDPVAGALCGAIAAGRARGAVGTHPARPRFPRSDAPPAARGRRRAVRERARQAAVSFQGVAVRHLADRHPVEDQPDGLGDPRLRPAKRLPAVPGRLVQSRPRPDGDVHCGRRQLSAAGLHRSYRDRGRTCDRYRARRRAHRPGEPVRRQHDRRASDLRAIDRSRPAAAAAVLQARRFQYTAWTLFGLHLACTRARALPRRRSTPTSTVR